jgi:hypothetical protein
MSGAGPSYPVQYTMHELPRLLARYQPRPVAHHSHAVISLQPLDRQSLVDAM